MLRHIEDLPYVRVLNHEYRTRGGRIAYRVYTHRLDANIDNYLLRRCLIKSVTWKRDKIKL